MVKMSFLVVAALAACNSSSSSRAPAGKASAIQACGLLTLDEIKQATGTPMGSGQLQTTDTQSSCDWNAPDGASGASAVGIIIRDFDGGLWKTMSSSPHATAVTGIGEQAYKGFPHQGDLTVKQGHYEVDVGIIDFKHAPAPVDAATLALMKLALSRL